MGTVSAVFVGNSGSGKTTFLAALWSTLRNARGHEYPQLSGNLPPNTQFLDAIEDALLSGTSVERTRLDSGEEVRLTIRLDQSSDVDVHYIDPAGESIRAVLLNRRAPELLMANLAEATATLLFIHPNDTEPMPMLHHPAAIVVDPEHENDDLPDGPSSRLDEEASEEHIWNDASSDIRHVELLQMCHEAARGG